MSDSIQTNILIMLSLPNFPKEKKQNTNLKKSFKPRKQTDLLLSETVTRQPLAHPATAGLIAMVTRQGRGDWLVQWLAFPDRIISADPSFWSGKYFLIKAGCSLALNENK